MDFYLYSCLLVYLSTCILVYLYSCILVYLYSCLLVFLSTFYLYSYVLLYFVTAETVAWPTNVLIKANVNQTAFYRVNYELSDWLDLAAYLLNNVGTSGDVSSMQ